MHDGVCSDLTKLGTRCTRLAVKHGFCRTHLNIRERKNRVTAWRAEGLPLCPEHGEEPSVFKPSQRAFLCLRKVKVARFSTNAYNGQLLLKRQTLVSCEFLVSVPEDVWNG